MADPRKPYMMVLVNTAKSDELEHRGIVRELALGNTFSIKNIEQ